MNQEEIRYLIRLVRKERKISQKELGQMTGISHQIISRYEKGAEIPTEEKLQLILSMLEIDYNKIELFKEEIDDLFDRFLEDLFFRKENFKIYLNKIKSNMAHYRHSFNYFKIRIIEFVCAVLTNNFDEIDKTISNIERLDVDDPKVLQIYYEYKGYYLLKRKRTKEGLEYLEEAKLQRYDEKAIAMIHYHMSFAYNYEWLRKTDAEYLIDAKNIFQKYYSLKRVSDCEMILGNYYSTYRNFRKAMQSYKNRLNLLELEKNDKEDLMNTYSTIAYVYIEQKQYKKALEATDKICEYGRIEARDHLYYIWCYYKLGEMSNANSWIVKMNRLNLDCELKMLWNLYEMLVAQYDKMPSDRLIEKAIKVYEYYKNQEDLDLSLFYVDIVIELLEKRSEYKRGFSYQKEKIFLLENI